MKLIDILVDAGDETPLFGVHTKYLAMDPDGRVHGYCEMPSPTALGWGIPDALYSTDGRGCLIQIDRDEVNGQWQSAIITREQYEAALASKNDGWIEWGGGKHTPVSTNTVVDVKFNDGQVQSGYPAGEYSWEHAWQNSNIIAYRLHKPQEADRVRAAAWNSYAGITESDGESDLNEQIGQGVAPVWNGEDLPPVGCFCEVEDLDGMLVYGQGESGEVIAHVENTAVIRMSYGLGCFEARFLRPLRTEAERKRDEAMRVIYEILDAGTSTKQDASDIYNAIAAGEIPSVKLED